MPIDEKAPVSATATVEIAAPPERVWQIITDFEHWPSWNPDVAWAELDGELEPGTAFRWKAGPGVIRSRLMRTDEPSHLEWTGRTMGIRAVHVWHLEPAGGGTVVETRESWDGLLPRLFRGYSTRTLGDSIRRGLDALKVAAERA
jgi:uncharacterized protein YndB with AHSA1/START domain